MEWRGKSVFVTGADGFIGGGLTKVLVDKGAKVVVVIRDIKHNNSLDLHNIRDKVTVVQGDIIDDKLMGRIMNEYEVEYVFHLAAQALVGIAVKSPISTFESNIKGTWSVLEAARNTESIKSVIVASSDKAYGDQPGPFKEDMPLKGVYPYDASKACTDIIAQSYYKTYNLPVVITRNANTYGSGDINMSRIIPDAIISSLKGKELLIRSDGTPVRDYMYIKDAVDAYLLLAENIEREGVKGEAFNFATEESISVLDLFKLVVRLTGNEIQPKILGNSKTEVDKLTLSSEKVRKTLNWTPKYNLEQGLKETIAWYKENLDLF